MHKFKSKYRIESARQRNWDYAKPGDYFITACCANHEKFFGEIVDDKMVFNELGEIANQCWSEIPQHFTNAELGEFRIMPNHLHGIIIITTFVFSKHQTIGKQLPSKFQTKQSHFRFPNQGENTVSAMVGSFKSAVTSRIHRLDTEALKNIASFAAAKQFDWQTRFHDHIIRSHEEFIRISNYIRNNPANWKKDKFYKP
jgi:REP element-mobilizing transposase RayT